MYYVRKGMSILPQLIVNSLIAGAGFALVAMSFNLIYGVSRSFNLAHGSLGAIGAYTVFALAKEHGVPLITVVPVGIALASLAALFLELVIFRPLRRRKASNLVLLIASLGAMVAAEALVSIFFTSQFQTLVDILGQMPVFQIGSAAITAVQIVIIGSAFVALFVLWLLLSFTGFGRAVRAIADDEEVARIVGIETDRIITIVFLIGGAVMGAAGILAGFDTGLDPRMGFLLLLDGAIAAIVGGIGNVYGAFLGAILLGFAENFGIFATSGEWKYAIAFSVLILFLLFRPQGFFGKKNA